ncbi:MAG TPA: SpoIID/LytB domain-containing protein [Gaiellaceae bacterium]|nr:SpoIID/LytB domain-containing protein [Gaiellaceae bacterium]
MPRRPFALVVLAALVAAGSAAAAPGGALAPAVCSTGCFAAPSGSGPLLVFTGHGWGHGVGMSQYGAYGYAQHGWTAQQILAHYYPGTTPGTAPVSVVRVLLADRKKKLTLSSDVPFRVRDGAGKWHTLAAGPVVLDPSLTLTVDGQATPQALPAPLTFRPGAGGPLTLTRPYRGQILVDVVDGKLRAIDIVGLEKYLYGVVPSEMPSSWSPEALKAQAIAARSYAMATRQVGAPFDLYSDTRSQMYLGISHEDPAASAAVDATKGQVLTYAGKVATTYFSSTSGGATESAADWTGVAVPYLVSVPDPFDTLSPYHDWGPVAVTGKTVASALKLPAPLSDITTTRGPTGRVASVDLLAPSLDVPVLGTAFRNALGLRSTWFSVGLISLTPPAPSVPVPYGSTIQLGGLIRGVSGVSLEQRTSLATWGTVAPVTAAPDGTVHLSEQPAITTDYRLATPTAAAGFVRIRVTPLVAVTSFTLAQVQGTVQPVLPDAPVTVQQQQPDLTWTDAATGVVAADGTFTIPAQLASGGTYRIVVAPGHGYWPATTAAQTVAR